MTEAIQHHPLYQCDRAIVDTLLVQKSPDSLSLTNAGRLFIRYNGFPGAYDIKRDLLACLEKWGMTTDELNSACRTVWGSGWRPGHATDELSVGSGAD